MVVGIGFDGKVGWALTVFGFCALIGAGERSADDRNVGLRSLLIRSCRYTGGIAVARERVERLRLTA